MIVNLTPLQRIQELSLECYQTDLEGISGVGNLLLPLTSNVWKGTLIHSLTLEGSRGAPCLHRDTALCREWSWWRIIWESRPYLQFQMSECIKYGTSKVADGNSILAGLWVILFPLSHPHASVEIRELSKMLAGCGILCWTKFLALFRTQIRESCWAAICWLLQLHALPPSHLLIVPDLSRCSVSWTNILLLCIFCYFGVCTNYSLIYVSCAPQSETFIM